MFSFRSAGTRLRQWYISCSSHIQHLVSRVRGYDNGIFHGLATCSVWFRGHTVTAMVYLLQWPYLVLVPQARGYGNSISLALTIFNFGSPGMWLWKWPHVIFGSAGTRLRQWYISCICHSYSTCKANMQTNNITRYYIKYTKTTKSSSVRKHIILRTITDNCRNYMKNS